MLEMYYKYRLKYEDYLIFIKIGSFYEVFDKDSLILNKLFGYKIKRMKDSLKVGFPTNRLDYVLKLIGNINYVVIDNTEIKKQKFKNNKYKDYSFNVNNIILNSIKIDRIYDTLNNKLLDSNIDDILNKIELILGRNI